MLIATCAVHPHTEVSFCLTVIWTAKIRTALVCSVNAGFVSAVLRRVGTGGRSIAGSLGGVT